MRYINIKVNKTIVIGIITWAVPSMLTAQVHFDHLTQINPHWTKDLFENIDKSGIPATKSDIANHLFLVESYLRTHMPEGLTQDQQINRINCLNVLRAYADEECFPKNLYHSERTPYFVDDFGTACAVGHLIIETGYEDLAYQIANEDNYLYLQDLAAEYSEVGDWAHKYGFSQEELEWIQPVYEFCPGPCCEYGETKPVYCFGACDGCFMPYPPEPIEFYDVLGFSFGPVWSLDDEGQKEWPGGYLACGLFAGFYSWEVSWILNDTSILVEYFFEITEPPALEISSEQMNDDGTCNGMISLMITGGVPPYQITWDNGQQGEGLVDLCAGMYTATIIDWHGCTDDYEVYIDALSISLQPQIDNTQIAVYTNPVSEILQIENPITKAIPVFIYSLLGEKIYSSVLEFGTNYIDMSSNPSGGYIVAYETTVGIKTRRIIKM